MVRPPLFVQSNTGDCAEEVLHERLRYLTACVAGGTTSCALVATKDLEK